MDVTGGSMVDMDYPTWSGFLKIEMQGEDSHRPSKTKGESTLGDSGHEDKRVSISKESLSLVGQVRQF